MNCYFELRLNTKQIPSSEYVLTRVFALYLLLLSHPPRLIDLLPAAIMLTLVGCVNIIYAHSLNRIILKQDERIDRSNGSSCTSRNYYR